jgi:hypothetical protein
LVSATHRETTRALIERIAKLLAERWEGAAKAPASSHDVAAAIDEIAHEGSHATTLDDLLRASGRRARKTLRS